MKPLFLLLCCMSVRAWAAWNVATEFRVVRLPVSSGLEIVELFSEERTMRDASAMVERMLADGRAVLVAELVGNAADGEDSASEAVTEHRYPTDFESPHPRLAPSRASGLAIPAAPIVMEVKNIGASLQLQPTVLQGGAVIQSTVRRSASLALRISGMNTAFVRMGSNTCSNSQNSLPQKRPPSSQRGMPCRS